jgi:hypothetical protein
MHWRLVITLVLRALVYLLAVEKEIQKNGNRDWGM